MTEMTMKTYERPAGRDTPTLRELFLASLIKLPSPDKDGYLCTKSDVLKAFDQALHDTWSGRSPQEKADE